MEAEVDALEPIPVLLLVGGEHLLEVRLQGRSGKTSAGPSGDPGRLGRR
jgi:hypothetical protein